MTKIKELSGKMFGRLVVLPCYETRKGSVPWNKGKKASDKYRKNMRTGRIRYIIKTGKVNGPNVGKHETQTLDNLEECFRHRILRQYPIEGYFLDGYCPTLNLAIEINEKNHRYKVEQDKYREQQVISKLKCSFLNLDVSKQPVEVG